MTIWFTSDEHYFHNNIVIYDSRPFPNVEEMNRGLIERHNAVVKTDDTVWHIGDFSLSEKHVATILRQLNGSHIIVSGNHDKFFRGHKKHEEATKRYLEYGFKECHQEATIGPFLINHLPYSGDSKDGPERYSQFRPIDTGKFLIHGHVHTSWKTKNKMINVGVPVNDYTPVDYETLLSYTK